MCTAIQAYQLIVRLLAPLSGEDTDEASSAASPVRQPDGKLRDGTGNSETYDGKGELIFNEENTVIMVIDNRYHSVDISDKQYIWF